MYLLILLLWFGTFVVVSSRYVSPSVPRLCCAVGSTWSFFRRKHDTLVVAQMFGTDVCDSLGEIREAISRVLKVLAYNLSFVINLVMKFFFFIYSLGG